MTQSLNDDGSGYVVCAHDGSVIYQNANNTSRYLSFIVVPGSCEMPSQRQQVMRHLGTKSVLRATRETKETR